MFMRADGFATIPWRGLVALGRTYLYDGKLRC